MYKRYCLQASVSSCLDQLRLQGEWQQRGVGVGLWRWRWRWRWRSSGLTGHLPQAADQQSLVVAAGKRDAVTQPVHQAVLDAMFPVCVGDTQQVLLQKF